MLWQEATPFKEPDSSAKAQPLSQPAGLVTRCHGNCPAKPLALNAGGRDKPAVANLQTDTTSRSSLASVAVEPKSGSQNHVPQPFISHPVHQPQLHFPV